ncbi:MAG: hypothetical protein CBD26_03930 [Candidatus Pelagibacter sp. TMED166]|nr:MAG: hypothetical protein CBD26_03930 [Candidatus Pelagibacter sp. TMED166]|tara:strand:+ start:4902 stop:5144 length:243 start_codon:yes stop_codon:yes gene_type:complete
MSMENMSYVFDSKEKSLLLEGLRRILWEAENRLSMLQDKKEIKALEQLIDRLTEPNFEEENKSGRVDPYEMVAECLKGVP